MNRPVLSRLERSLLGKVGKAVSRYDMIGDGDRVLVAVSGGPDSFLMLKLLYSRLDRITAAYRLYAGHVNIPGLCDGGDLSQAFVRELRALRIPLVVRTLADDTPPRGSPCFRCSWLRRKALFEIARDVDAHTIALGHHADDLAETAIMNLFWHGQFSTMQPVVTMMQDRFTVVRPMIYVSKKSIERWRRTRGRGFFTDGCRRNGARSYVRELLDDVYGRNRAARTNLLRSLRIEHHSVRGAE